MSRIDTLIAELAPGEVEFKLLSEVGVFIRGNGLHKADLTDEGVPAIHYGQVHTHYGIWATSTKSFVRPDFASKLRRAKPGDLIVATTSEDDAAVAKAVAWIGKSEVAVGGDAYIFRHSLDPKYAAYFFSSERFQTQKTRYISGTKVRRISGTSLSKIRIPVPPPEVQREIVRILDELAGLEAELRSELKAELKARKKQYFHYRSSLFAPDKVGSAFLEEVARNLDYRRKPVTRSARIGGKYPYYGASGVVDQVSDFIFDGDYLLVSEDGANLLARTSPIAFSVSGQVWVNNHAHVLEFSSHTDRRYVEFYLNSVDLSVHITGAAQPKLNQANLNRISIPWPGVEEREHAVETLDKFDALVRDLEIGLIDEIAARRKQYEYYRDKLLTFKEKVA